MSAISRGAQRTVDDFPMEPVDRRRAGGGRGGLPARSRRAGSAPRRERAHRRMGADLFVRGEVSSELSQDTATWKFTAAVTVPGAPASP